MSLWKIPLLLFLLGWIGAGGAMLWKHDSLFGQPRDEPFESPGARSLSMAHLWAVWFGFFAMAVYFLLLG